MVAGVVDKVEVEEVKEEEGAEDSGGGDCTEGLGCPLRTANCSLHT